MNKKELLEALLDIIHNYNLKDRQVIDKVCILVEKELGVR